MARIDKKSLMTGSNKEDQPQRTAAKAAKRNTEGKTRFGNFARYLSVSQRSLRLLILLVLVSCQSAPKTFDAVLEDGRFLPLESGASFYIVADVKEARSIIDLLPVPELNDKQTRQMLDRTDFLAAALFPRESGKRFQLVTWGNYPSSQAGIAFSADKNWKKRRSQTGGFYWNSSANGLSIAMNRRTAYVASSLTDAPCDPLTPAPGIKTPDGFQEFRAYGESSGTNSDVSGAKAPLSFWIENPAASINKVLNNAGIHLQFSIQALFINLSPAAENKHEAVIRLQFENQSRARSIAAMINLGANFVNNDPGTIIAQLFFVNAPLQNGNNLDIKSAPLGAEELALIFSLFMPNLEKK